MTFYVPEDVTMIGGWLGNEPPNGDPMGAPENTILSGDLGVLGDSQDNCYHVVVPQVIKGTAPSTVKRFLIVDGNANGTGANNEDMGGGILCLGASVVLDQLTIRDNFAEIGGGIAISSVFDPDQGTNEQTDLKMKRCTLRSNLASAKGGAFYAFESGAIEVVNCRFRNNGGGVLDGGAIALDKKIHDTRFVNCLIYDNTARRYGGGIWADYPDCNGCGFFFINCTVAFNVVTDPAPFSHGAGLYVMGGNTANNVGYGAVNTILWKNPGTANNETCMSMESPQATPSKSLIPVSGREPPCLGTSQQAATVSWTM